MSGANISVSDAATASSHGYERHTHGLANAQPRFGPALFARPPVMVDDPLNPLLPHLAFGAVGEDQRVLDRNVDLVVEPVRHPALELLARQLAPVHPLVEGMEVMVAADQHVAQPARQLAGRG